jgi:alpha-glucosidase
LIFSFLLFGAGCNQHYGKILLNSPNENLRFSLGIDQGYPSYSVNYRDHVLIKDSPLSLVFKETGEFGRNLRIYKPRYRTIDESYNLVVGKTKTARNFCNEVTIPLIEKVNPFRRINIVIRTFNDGIAFRYEFQEQQKLTSFSLVSENSTFKFTENPAVLTLFRPDFCTSHEGLYSKLSFNSKKNDTLMDIPVLFDFQGIYMAITEAALVDYAGMYLVKKGGVLTGELSPLPRQGGICVKAGFPSKSLWRVMMISDRIGDLFESDILTNLNEPCKIEDTSWIKPGKATWPWWNGSVVGDSTITAGNNFETNKYYIDFCARNGIEYHSVVIQWSFSSNSIVIPLFLH